MHNGEAQYARDAGKLDGLAPEAYIQPQDNILDNADWESGIINQQAKDEYTDGGCTIDRWSVNSKNVKLKVLKDKISVEILKETTTITWAPSQDIEFSERFQGKTLTAATVIDFIDGDWSLFIRFANDNEYIAGPQKKLKAGLNILSYMVPEGTTHIKCGLLSQAQPAGKSVQARKIKLESGPYFTGWPVWNYVLELAKCQRYQFNLSGDFIVVSATGANLASIFVSMPVTMRKTPVVKDFSIQSIALDGQSYNAEDFTYSHIFNDKDHTHLLINLAPKVTLPRGKVGTIRLSTMLNANL